jgi:hypothetical protein
MKRTSIRVCARSAQQLFPSSLPQSTASLHVLAKDVSPSLGRLTALSPLASAVRVPTVRLPDGVVRLRDGLSVQSTRYNVTGDVAAACVVSTVIVPLLSMMNKVSLTLIGVLLMFD